MLVKQVSLFWTFADKTTFSSVHCCTSGGVLRSEKVFRENYTAWAVSRMLQGQLKRDQAARAVVVRDRLKGQLVEICCKGNSNSFAARAAENGKGQYSMHTMSVLRTSLQGQPILSGSDDSQNRQGPTRGARAPISRLVETRGFSRKLENRKM